MHEHRRSEGSRSAKGTSKKARRIAAGAGALILLLVAVPKLIGIRQHARARDAVKQGRVVLEGVRANWDLERDTMSATLYLLNKSESELEGELAVEFSPDPERLAESYLEELVVHEVRRGDVDRLVSSLEGRPRLSAKEQSLLSYLKRGQRTDNPSYETILRENGVKPDQLVFRKSTTWVTLPPGELVRVVVTQDIPEARMGEYVDEKNTRIVGIEF